MIQRAADFRSLVEDIYTRKCSAKSACEPLFSGSIGGNLRPMKLFVTRYTRFHVTGRLLDFLTVKRGFSRHDMICVGVSQSRENVYVQLAASLATAATLIEVVASQLTAHCYTRVSWGGW